MNADLEAIKDAWSKETGGGREEERTRAMCDAYVAAHPELFAAMELYSIEECVEMVSMFRSRGNEEMQWNYEVWLLHHFEPQNIGGVAQARVRRPGGGA
jgi:hypothetical protein